jgi:hypothetical protein
MYVCKERQNECYTAAFSEQHAPSTYLDIGTYRHTGRTATSTHAIDDRNFAAAAAEVGAAANAHIKHLHQHYVCSRNIVSNKEIQARCKQRGEKGLHKKRQGEGVRYG